MSAWVLLCPRSQTALAPGHGSVRRSVVVKPRPVQALARELAVSIQTPRAAACSSEGIVAGVRRFGSRAIRRREAAAPALLVQVC